MKTLKKLAVLILVDRWSAAVMGVLRIGCQGGIVRKSMRITAASAGAAMALGIAASMASATEANRTAATGTFLRMAAASEAAVEYYPEVESSSEADAMAEGAMAAGRLSKIIEALKRSPALLKAAIRAAKAGHDAFFGWVYSLSNWNPVKWAILWASWEIQWALIDWLVQQAG